VQGSAIQNDILAYVSHLSVILRTASETISSIRLIWKLKPPPVFPGIPLNLQEFRRRFKFLNWP
jgi:hypothetical protein